MIEKTEKDKGRINIDRDKRTLRKQRHHTHR